MNITRSIGNYFAQGTASFVIRAGVILFSIIFVFLSILAAQHYVGNKIEFAIFCFICAFMISLNYFGKFSYFYFFLSIFLLLGFWSKTSLFFAIKHPLLEPTGYFTYSPKAWDKAIMVSIFGLLGISLAKLVGALIETLSEKRKQPLHETKSQIPSWYQQNHKLCWGMTFIFVIFIALLNSHLNLYKTGFIPKYVLPMKLGAFVPALMNLGISFWLATMMWWDAQSKQKLYPQFAIVTVCAFLTSASILSRGLYIYQAGHYMVSFYRVLKNITLKQWFFFLGLFVIGLFATVKISMYQRNHAFADGIANVYTHTQTTDHSSTAYQSNLLRVKHYMKKGNYSSSGAGNIFLKLATERWIGIEGVMAVSSWHNLNRQTFLDGWTQRLAQNTKNPYGAISRIDHFRPSYSILKKQFFFSSLPGFIGMLFYSGNLLIVLVGTFLIGGLYLLLEKILSRKLNNPFYISYYGVYFAFLISMLGDGHVLFAQTIELIAFSIIFYALQIAGKTYVAVR